MPDPSVRALSGDPIIREALDRFNLCAEWESSWRARFIEDVKFRHGDSDNGYQWPNAIKRARDVDQRPGLTMNVIRQHNLQIVNEGKRRKSEIKIIGLGNGATSESARVIQTIVRHILYQSDAQSAFSVAREFQVDGGLGWWRVVTDYTGPDTFDQDIYILPVNDPLAVYADPDAQQRDLSDMNYALVFDNIPKDQFKKAFPKYEGVVGTEPLGVSTVGDAWITEDHVRVAEYFRRVPKRHKLISFMDEATGQRKTVRDSALPPEVLDAVLSHRLTKWREVFAPVVEWRLIAGEQVIDETDWMGDTIPLVRIIGEETTVGGVLDRKGHTRAMKDAQRMYNYNASSQVEHVALQSKTPWVTPVKAIEGHESIWNTANTVNHSVLPYNHKDDDASAEEPPIPPPSRQEPPQSSPAYQAGMDTAFNQMMMTSGQWQNQMGMMGNERTGKAISERQEQSDTAVYHFYDNYAQGLRRTGKVIIELLPKVYDTRRVKRMLADDGVELEVELDPAARLAYFQQLNHQGEVIKRVLNPTIGLYDVAPDVGPAFGSQMQETADALTVILTQAPALTGIIGDLLLASLPFEKAQEAAQRLKRMVPPLALGKGPSQIEQQLQQQVTSLQAALAKVLERQGKDSLKLVGKNEMRDIDVFKAITERAKVMLDHGLANRELDQQLHEVNLDAILRANEANSGEGGDNPGSTPGIVSAPAPVSPVPGAQRAPDGEWYLADPTRRGKYMRVAPLAQERLPRNVIDNA